jgi:hypothetical protein
MDVVGLIGKFGGHHQLVQGGDGLGVGAWTLPLRGCRKRLSGSVRLAVASGLGASCGRRLSVRGLVPLAVAAAAWAATRCW